MRKTVQVRNILRNNDLVRWPQLMYTNKRKGGRAVKAYFNYKFNYKDLYTAIAQIKDIEPNAVIKIDPMGGSIAFSILPDNVMPNTLCVYRSIIVYLPEAGVN